MEQTTLTIGGKQYPYRYSMAAIQRVLTLLKVNPAELAQKPIQQDFAQLVEFSLAVAYSGILSAHKIEHPGKPFAFASPEDLAEQIESLDELQPAVEAFTKAWLKFVGTPEDKEGEEPGEPLTAPAAN